MNEPEGNLPAAFHGDMTAPNYARDPILRCVTCHGQVHVMVHNQVPVYGVSAKQ